MKFIYLCVRPLHKRWIITQFNIDYLLDKDKSNYNKKYFDKTFELLTICSKNELDDKLINCTTEKDNILSFLNK